MDKFIEFLKVWRGSTEVRIGKFCVSTGLFFTVAIISGRSLLMSVFSWAIGVEGGKEDSQIGWVIVLALVMTIGIFAFGVWVLVRELFKNQTGEVKVSRWWRAILALPTAAFIAAPSGDAIDPEATGANPVPRFSHEQEKLVFEFGMGFQMLLPKTAGTHYPLSGFRDCKSVWITTDEDGQCTVNANLISDLKWQDIEVRQNAIVSQLPMGWDRNWDANSLEIVDDKLRPRFQVTMASSGEVKVLGCFVCADEKSFVLVDVSGIHSFLAKPEPLKAPRIFEYPAFRHEGQRVGED